MFRALAVVLLSSFPLSAQEPGGTPEKPAPTAEQVRSVEDLIRYVEARESAVEAVRMGIETSGRFPDGTEFRTSGTLRVLGETHFHSSMRMQLGPDMTFETETVRTPGGQWMREKDPIQGEIWLHMDQETMARVESAERALGVGESESLAGRPSSPLGSAMLRDLDRQFDLELSGPKVVDGQQAWVAAGPVRGSGDSTEDVLGTGADRVDVVVRVADGAIVSMTQFDEGRPLLQIRITELALDEPLAQDSFVLEVPDRVELIDVLDNPARQAQLQALFEEAAEKGWQDPAAGGEPPPRETETEQPR